MNDLPEFRQIDFDHGFPFSAHFVPEVDPLALSERFELRGDPPKEDVQFGGLGFQLHLAHFELAQIEDLGDQFFELLAALGGHLQQLPLLVVQLPSFEQGLDGAEQ